MENWNLLLDCGVSLPPRLLPKHIRAWHAQCWRKETQTLTFLSGNTNSFTRLTFGQQKSGSMIEYNTKVCCVPCLNHLPRITIYSLLFSSLLYSSILYSIPNTTAFWTFSLPPHRSCFRVFKAGFRWLLSRKTASRLHGLSSPLHYSRHCYRLTIMSPCRGKALVRLWSRHSLLSPPLISPLYFVHFLLREVL